MDSHPRRRQPADRRAGDLARGLGALLGLVALLIGLPVALWVFTTALLPTGLPTAGDLRTLLIRQDIGGPFFAVLALIGWAGWAAFAVSVLLEIPAQHRGRTARRLPGLGTTQKLAATLIGSLALLAPASALALPTPAAAAVLAPLTAAAAAPASQDPATPSTPATAPEDSTPVPSRLYTVAATSPADSLWSIAERELGDGERWRQIAALNQGRTMADGAVFDANAGLRPGWQLHLPPRAEPPSGTHRVEAGESLWQIADEELGDPYRWPQLYQANRDQIDDPDLIHPGWHLTLPEAAARPATAPSSKAQPTAGDHPATPNLEATPTSAPTAAVATSQAPAAAEEVATARPQPQTPQSEAVGPPAAAPEPATTPAPTWSPAPTQTPPAAQTTTESVDVSARTVAGIGTLLAAGLLGSLGLARILQQRRRRPGETIAMPPAPSDLERGIAEHSEPGSVALLNRAVRQLAAHAAATGQELPLVRSARVTPTTVELILDEAGEPIAPFTAGAHGRHWVLEASALADQPPGTEVPAPYPALVVAGSDEAGNHLLVNLEYLGTVLLDGDEDQVRAVARALALDAALSEWADYVEVLCVGFAEELPGVLPSGRLRYLPDARQAVTELTERVMEIHQVLQAAGVADVRSARSLRVAEAAWTPTVIVFDRPVADEQAWQLAELATHAAWAGVALVLPAQGVTQLFGKAAIWRADDQAHPCEPLEDPVRLQQVTDAAYQQLLAALQTADAPAHPAHGAWMQVPAGVAALADEELDHLEQACDVNDEEEPGNPVVIPFATVAGLHPAEGEPADQPDAEDRHAPEVRVLGVLKLAGEAITGRHSVARAPKLAELAAYLLLHPGRSAEDIAEAMGTSVPWSATTLNARISELRSWLGTDTEGKPYLPRHAEAGYRLDRVRCDWHRFEALAQRGLARKRQGVAELEAALALVRSRPFAGKPYVWAEPLRQRIISRIVDVAHAVAFWRMVERNHDAARQAIAVGLDVEPAAELLYQDWIKLEDRAGNPTGVQAAIEQLQTINARLGVDMEPETEQVITAVMSKTLHRATAM